MDCLKRYKKANNLFGIKLIRWFIRASVAKIKLVKEKVYNLIGVKNGI